MSKILHLYGAESDLTALKGTAGLLCEFAPDSPWLQRAEQTCHPHEMLGSVDAALNVAYSLVSKLIDAVSAIGDVPILTIFEESLLEQISYIVQTFHLDRWIRSQGFTACRFESYSPWVDRLRQVHSLLGSEYALMDESPFGQTNWFRRGVGRLWRSPGRPSELFRRVAPLWSRYLSAAPAQNLAHRAPRGG